MSGLQHQAVRETMIPTLYGDSIEPNVVCTAELGESLNLNALAIGLGLEKIEYEPEQFPGLIYRSADFDSVVLLFASGRVVITGSPDLDSAERTFRMLSEEVTDILNIN